MITGSFFPRMYIGNLRSVPMTRALLVVFFVTCSACGNSSSDHTTVASTDIPFQESRELPSELIADLQTLAAGRAYFGHHSVGRNIIEGLERIAERANVDTLRVLQVKAGSPLPATFFAHSGVGQNKDPKSKVEDFLKRIRGYRKDTLDIAFMKFCYVDFDPYTDVDELFAYYRSSMDSLSEKRRDIRFLHATVPLKVHDLSFKDRVQKLLGRTVWDEDANIKRFEFNERLRATYSTEQIIDIAAWESTGPEGTTTFRKHGRKFPALNPAFTTDGGHLNEAGSEAVAIAMIRVLAKNLSSGAKTE
jgi:hypothetical protein